MEFSELWFVTLFLPLTILIYFLMPTLRTKNAFLLLASMAFYGIAQPIYLFILLALTSINYLCSKHIEGRAGLVLPIALTLLVLITFKLCANLKTDLVILPLGISYYTFCLIAYQVDIFRKKHEPAKCLSDLLLFAFLFPKIIVGPIVRFADFAPQIKKRRADSRTVFFGLQRFVFGLAKKVLLADHCAKVIAECDTSGAGAWLSALMFAFQIYFEFSGCCDMANGMAKIFGFTFSENFDLPYCASSITDFWRRWHISLGSFFRDYVYIPLGGNRKGKIRQIFNMLIVWALTGLWHGLSLNYLLWGLYFFVLLVVEKSLPVKKLPKPLRLMITSVFILFGWVIFSGQNLRELFAFEQFWSTKMEVQLRNSLPLLLACIFGCTPLPRKISALWSRMQTDKLTFRGTVCALGRFVLIAALIWLCAVSLLGATNTPDIYGGSLR